LNLPGPGLDSLLSVPYDDGVDDIATQGAVHRVKGLAWRGEHIVVPFGKHQAVATGAVHELLLHQRAREIILPNGQSLLQSVVQKEMNLMKSDEGDFAEK